MINNNTINLKINDIIKKVHERDLDGIFKNYDYLKNNLEKEVAIKIFSNILRIFLLKDGAEISFLEEVANRFRNDYDFEHPSKKVSLILIDLLTNKIEKNEALTQLLSISKNEEYTQQERIHSFIQFGNIMLSSKNKENNLNYFEELDKLIGDENYIVDTLNYDNVSLRFNYDSFEITLKLLEMKLMAALEKGDSEKINDIFEEIVVSVEKLKESEVPDDYYLTTYTVSKMKTYTGEMDLESYYNKLYREIEDYKGFVLEGYYDYLSINYPYRLGVEFEDKFKDYWENHYQKESKKSKEAFLYTALDFLSGYGVVDFVNLETIIEEIEEVL
jgi:hypothetical protein